MTPEIGLGVRIQGATAASAGGGSGARDGGSFALSLEGRRRESANGNAPAEPEAGFRLTARW